MICYVMYCCVLLYYVKLCYVITCQFIVLMSALLSHLSSISPAQDYPLKLNIMLSTVEKTRSELFCLKFLTR